MTVAATCVSAGESSFGPLSFTGVQKKYFGLVIRSFHINPNNQEAASLNDDTPGVTIGRRYETKKRSGEAFLEGGVFYNSYEEVSPVFLAGYTFSALNFPNGGQFRIGGFTGIGYYKELGKTLREDYGVPYYKGYIPLIGATISYRYKRNELRLTTVPGDNLDVILNLSFARSF